MRPFRLASSVKCLRYQESPSQGGITGMSVANPTQSTNSSTSLKVCGRDTSVHVESSNAGACAPATSMRMNFQP